MAMAAGKLVRFIASRARMRAYDTVVGRAFMRAAGVAAPEPWPEAPAVLPVERYAGLGECFANRTRVDLGDRS